MLDSVFLKILNMSFTAGIVILVVLLARFLLRRAPKIFSYLLWSVVLFRLLCPVSFSTQLSVLQFADAAGTAAGNMEALQDIVRVMPIGRQGDFGASSAESVEQHTQGHTSGIDQAVVFCGVIVWLAGIAVMLGGSFRSLFRLRRRLVGAVHLRENIYLADHVASPFVFGVARPRIYLPTVLSDTEQEYIILHEKIHIERGDHLVKILAFAALTIHWFNPLVWLAFYLSGIDMEMSCDEAVMEKMGNGIRAEYSVSLLNLATGKKYYARTFPNFGEGDTGSRIKHVMRYKKPTAAVIVIAAIVLLTTLVFAGSDPGKQAAGIDGQVESMPVSGSVAKDLAYIMRTHGLDNDFAYNMQCGFFVAATDNTVEVDLVEYVEIEDTERVKELGLTEMDDMPDGYYFHNPDTDTVVWQLDSDTQYLFIDWDRNFVHDPDDLFMLTKDREMFGAYLETYLKATPGSMPFFFYVEDGVVKLVVEKPFA